MLKQAIQHQMFYFCFMIDENYRYHYRAYGLNVASQVPITGFKENVSGQANVFIYENTVPENLNVIINRGPVFQSNDHEFLLYLENIGSFYIRNGNEIIVNRLAGPHQNDFSTFVSGACFGALLHQRGLLPLHASSVVFKNKGILIAGVSGAGKSTLAASFVKNGGKLVADDISCVSYSDKKLLVLPSFPTIKIWHDSLLHLELFKPDLQPVRDSLLKYYLPVENFNDTPAHIHVILILSSRNKPEIEIREIKGVEKFRLLKKNTYFFRGIEGTSMVQKHFQLIMNMASSIPVYQIIRPVAGIETETLIKAISVKLDIG
jgi:hypothetical protein